MTMLSSRAIHESGGLMRQGVGMKHESVQDLFSKTAGVYRGEVAVEKGGVRLSYGELEAGSNQVANWLLKSGAGKGSLVGVMCGESQEVIRAVLGILKAGCVFVPLDPTFPEQRLRQMLRQARPGWYVVETKY